MPAYLIPALTTAFSSAMQFWARKKPKPFRSTAEGKYLQEVGREGAISSQTQGIIAGRVGRDAGNVAGQRVSRLRGFLQARGMGGSIAGARLLDQPLQDYQRTVADTRENVTMQNEQTKTAAKMQFAQKSNQYDEVRRQDQNQAIQQFAGGLSSAAQQGFEGYAQDRQLKSRETYDTSLLLNALSNYDDGQMNGLLDEVEGLMKAGRKDEALRLIQDLIQRSGVNATR